MDKQNKGRADITEKADTLARNCVKEYWEAICAGCVTVPKTIRAVYKKLVKGLDEGKWQFNAKKANMAVKFIEHFCHHSEGRHDLLKLELWQKAMVHAIFGFVDEEGNRVFHEVFLVVARKNGKTLFAAALIACCAYIDGEYGAKIYCLAPKLEQSNIVFNAFWQMVKAETELSAITRKRRNDLYIEQTNTSVQPQPFNAKKSDGYNPHMVVNDEIAAWPAATGLKQYGVMKSAFGARKQPLMISISTAGYVDDGVYDELMLRSMGWLDGQSREKHLLPILYIIDDITKWNDIEELKKSNPNLGVSVQPSFYEDAIAIAERSLVQKAEYLTKYCNIKQNSSVAWLRYEPVAAAQCDMTLKDFQRCYAIGGFDLSQTTDLTAACIVIEREGTLYVFTKFFMPAEGLQRHIERENVPYDIYVQRGDLQLSEGEYVDQADVLKWYEWLKSEYRIYTPLVGYDRWMAGTLVDDMKARGYKMDDVNQGFNLSPILYQFEGMLLNGQIKICGNNSLMQQHMLNVAVKIQPETRRIKMVKTEERAHIDGCAALIDALTVRDKHYNELGAILCNRKRESGT